MRSKLLAIKQGYATTERVIDGMVKIAVAELGAEASVRRHLRELYIKHVYISTGAFNTCLMCVSYQNLMPSVVLPMSAMVSVSGFCHMYACNHIPCETDWTGQLLVKLLRRSSVCLSCRNVASHSNIVSQLLAHTWQYNLVRKSAVQ